MTGKKSVIGAKIVYDPEITDVSKIDAAIAGINSNLAEFKKIRKTDYTTQEFIKTSTGKIKRDLV